MPWRYRHYRTGEDAAAEEFAAWLVVLGGIGVKALWDAIRPRPSPYMPVAPDNPTQVNPFAPLGRMLKNTKIDLSNVKPPTIDLSNPDRPTVSWAKEHRPKIEQLGGPDEETLPVPAQPRTALSYRIYPSPIEAEYRRGISVMQMLLPIAPTLSFEIVAEAGTTYWQITDPEGQFSPATIVETVRSVYPEATVEVMAPWEGQLQWQFPFYRQLLLFGLVNEYATPIPFLDMLKGNDPLATIVQRMDFLKPEFHERLVYQLHVVVPTGEALRRAYDRLGEGMVKALSGLVYGKKEDPIAGLDLEFLNAKLAGPLYHCFLSVTIESQKEFRLSELSQIVTAISLFRTERHNAIKMAGGTSLKRTIEEKDQAEVSWFDGLLETMVAQNAGQWRDLLLVLCPSEIASLWHLPNETFAAKNILWATAQVPETLTTGNPEERVVIGTTSGPGQAKMVSLALNDRAYHATILGKTGAGKSTLLHNLIAQDIAAGRGVVVIDTHGKLVDQILARSIPQKRIKDVVLYECGRGEYPVPLNPFRVPAGISYTRSLQYVLWAIEKIYEHIWREGQTELVLRNVVSALLTDPEATPLDISRLFTDDAYRERVVNGLEAHPDASMAVVQYWRDEFPHFSPGERQRLLAPIRNRSTAFLGSRHLEHMTCHPNTLDFVGCLAEHRIVLIKLSGEAIEAEMKSLGALLLSGFYMASETLGYLPDNTPPRSYLYVDDVERLLTSPLPDMFAQARKFGLSLTLANQYLDQLASDTLKGILGNAGTTLLFEVGKSDAEGLGRLFAPDVTPDDLMTLGVHRMAVKTRAEGKNVPAFVVSTRDIPPVVANLAEAQTIRERMEKSVLPAQAVREWIAARYRPKPKPAAPPPEEAPAKNPQPKATPKKRSKKEMSDYE